MIKRALIIAPHPDDEINLAGQLIVKMNKLGIEIFVMYTTNGDAEAKIGNKRIKEAIEANNVLGVKEDHVIFLGYPNEWQGKKHVYNAADDELLVSKLGKTETNSIESHPEFCLAQKKEHHKFTRHNFKRDYREVIEFIMADLLIAPEFDSHPDHRATSLLFDEIMGEILKANTEYRPIILKKYIHEGVWYGPKDYYQMLPTVTSGPREYSGGKHDLDTPCFQWDERMIFGVEEEALTELLKDNTVYKAAKMHKVTTAWYEMLRVLNSDLVYWQRKTKNEALKAKIVVSSGDGSFLNDFKYYSCNNVLDMKESFCDSKSFCWIPNDEDMRKSITMDFSDEIVIERIVVYEDCNVENHIKKLGIYASGKELVIVELENSGAKKEIYLEKCRTNSLELRVLEWDGVPGVAEVEVYEQTANDLNQMEMFEKQISKADFQKKFFQQKFEMCALVIKFLFRFKIKYEISKFVKTIFRQE